MPEKTYEQKALIYKAKCINIIKKNNIRVAPKNVDTRVFDALLEIADRQEKRKKLFK